MGVLGVLAVRVLDPHIVVVIPARGSDRVLGIVVAARVLEGVVLCLRRILSVEPVTRSRLLAVVIDDPSNPSRRRSNDL